LINSCESYSDQTSRHAGEESCHQAKDFRLSFCHYLYVVSLPSLCFCGVNYSRSFSHINLFNKKLAMVQVHVYISGSNSYSDLQRGERPVSLDKGVHLSSPQIEQQHCRVRSENGLEQSA
jgi:hypothetical protein